MIKLSVSNLAWASKYDEAAAEILSTHGALGLDLAPGRYFPRPWEASVHDWRAVAKTWRGRGFELVGMQSLLFGVGPVSLFGSSDDRNLLTSALREIGSRASEIGVKRLVLGSPSNRKIGAFQGNAEAVAGEFFAPIAQYFEGLGISLLLEPNSTRYGCDFINSTAQAIDLASAIDSIGFGVNFDFGAEEDSPSIKTILSSGLKWVGHVHLSNPHLAPLEDMPIDFFPIWEMVSTPSDYWLALEQLGNGEGSDLVGLDKSLAKVTQAIGDVA